MGLVDFEHVDEISVTELGDSPGRLNVEGRKKTVGFRVASHSVSMMREPDAGWFLIQNLMEEVPACRGCPHCMVSSQRCEYDMTMDFRARCSRPVCVFEDASPVYHKAPIPESILEPIAGLDCETPAKRVPTKEPELEGSADPTDVPDDFGRFM